MKSLLNMVLKHDFEVLFDLAKEILQDKDYAQPLRRIDVLCREAGFYRMCTLSV